MSLGKEVPGGAVPAGFTSVAVEWHDDLRVAVPVAHFDFGSLDSLKDVILEALEAGQDIEPILKAWIDRKSVV